jgi:hypothetical protein
MIGWKPLPFIGRTANEKILRVAERIQDEKKPGMMLFDPVRGWAACNVMSGAGYDQILKGAHVLAAVGDFFIVAVNPGNLDPALIEEIINRESSRLDRPPSV